MSNEGTRGAAAEARLKALMLRGLDGDAMAYRDLLAEVSRLLRAYYARRLGGAAAEAEDLTQEVLIAVHSRRATFDRAQPFTAWLYAVARYKLIDHLRRRKVRAAVPLDDALGLFTPDESEAATASGDIDTLLAHLPPKQSAAIRYVKVEERSVAETAKLTGMSEGAIKVSVHRGLRALAARVRKDSGRAD
jgi:RNA polymerase sigma-70 factor (ECF subfamily)